jgi:multimeric flavodoxin WrbA
MKIVAIMGTYRKNGAGARLVAGMEQAFKTTPGVELETVWLGDCDMKLCRGCTACYDRGEAACPLKDGYLTAMAKLNSADAAIFYSPTYTLSISGLMKTFFDRSSYVLHRPYFRGRHAVVLTAAQSYGDKPAMKTLKAIVSMMGFAVDGAVSVVNAKYAVQPQYRERTDRKLEQAALRLVEQASGGKKLKPSLVELMIFNFQKTSFSSDTNQCRSDKAFWKNAGWTQPDTAFYCDTRISPLKKALAKAIANGIRKRGLLPG